MAQDGYPEDPRTWASFKRVEERTFRLAAACTFTTTSAARFYAERYPNSRSRIEVIENGYDEEAFTDADREPPEPLNPEMVTILHSGIVYPQERDPTYLFMALSALKKKGVDGNVLRVRFRAAFHDGLIFALATQYGVQDMIEIAPHIPYRQALREMLCADGLLVLQAANCNAQVPAKLYEYLRARKPVIALTDAEGDTAKVLRASGIEATANLDDPVAIEALLHRFLRPERHGMIASDHAVARASRARRAQELAALLDSVCERSQ